jgi:amino acid adenylation domain-containing protein
MATGQGRRRVAALTPEERTRLEARLLAAAPAARSSLPRRDPAAPVPLSLPQQRLWFLHRLIPESPAYHIPLAARLIGPLEVEALRRSLEAVVHRHEALRTALVLEDGEPRQRIAPPGPLTLPVEDLAGAAAAEREAAVNREATTPFDLERGPLLRARLLRQGADEHVLVITMHHLISDGWSMGILSRELEGLYAAFRAGRIAALPPLPVQYGDYAVWQRWHIAEAEMAAQLAYWRERLAGAPPALALPTDRPRPALQSFAGARMRVAVAGEVADALRVLGRQEGCTLYMTLLAAFQLLLGRYAGQEDVLVGSPIAGRGRTELEGIIGFFANTLVLRGDLGGDPTFRELLRRTRETALGAFAHDELPFERLVEAVRPQRDPSRNPLFQVMFALQNAPRVPLALAGLEIVPIQVERGSSKVDLSLALAETADGLLGSLEYCSALFDATTIARMVGHLDRLLEEVARDPDRPIARLPLLGDTERRQILVEWNATRTDYPADRSVPALFAEQAARAPAAVAVTDGPRSLTYADLQHWARGLADRLRDLGICRGARVGVCCDRSIEQIVAVLGVLAAGAAYVPLDPTHPTERRAALLDDAGATAVVTAGAGAGSAGGRPEIALDRFGAEEGDAAAAGGAKMPPLGGADLAYVMYTSGSSGAPKGVAVPHRAVVRLVRDTDYVRLGADDVVAQVSNPAFDAATFEIWGALLNGARLVLIPAETALSPRALAAALAHHGVTTLFLTTALFNQVAREIPAAFRDLRQVLFGGETVEPRWVEAVLRAGGPARLLHVYGPTETTTFATWHEVRGVSAGEATVPIGRPIANTEIYILDAHREPVPIAVAGEIFIGGPGLAEGYLDRPELTAERFVSHPFDPAPGARLYRTGDRARFRPDGAVEFLGRLDRQVKLRGHRVEPEEVEAALLRLPAVGEAVVVMEGETSETHRLVAYVAPAPGARPTPAELREALRRSLPSFMVPAAVVVLPILPLTPNGKVDRGALRAAGAGADRAAAPRVAPRNPAERALVAIWEELLGVGEIGVRDSFFDLGGHSLLAARMMDAVERACGRRIPLAALFTTPTIEHLVQALRMEVAASEPPLVELNGAGTRPPFFFLHGDFTGGGFFSRALADALGPNQPFYAVHPHGLVDSEMPDSIEAMAADRLAVLRATRPRGPYLLGGHCNGGLVALEMARLLTERGEVVPLVVLLDATAPRRAARIAGAVVRMADALLQIPRERRGDRLLRWREREAAMAARLRYYRARLEDFSRGDYRERARFIAGVAGRALAAARLRATARGGAAAQDPLRPPRRAAGSLAARYERAMRAYLPARYGGRILVLRSEEEADPRADLGWSSICRHVETHSVPGDHLGAITRHIGATGERLRACLERALPS